MSQSLKTFLWDNRVTANSNDNSTHTRIGKKHVNFAEDGWEIYGGNYSIKDMDEFYKLYVDKVFINKYGRLITERPEFYIALTSMIIGSQFFLAGFLGEIIYRNKKQFNYKIKEHINLHE